jgi:hypothetical protein
VIEALRGTFSRGSDRGGWVPPGDYGGGAPRFLPCGCRPGHRCYEAQALWLEMVAAARVAITTRRFGIYTYWRQQFLAHYIRQTDTAGAVLATQWR